MASRNAEPRGRIVRRTKNVFADLGFPDAAERQVKMRLAYCVTRLLDGRKLSRAKAGKALGLPQAKIQALRGYKLGVFSVERLMALLTALDQDIDIVIQPKPRSRNAARIHVVAAGLDAVEAPARQRDDFAHARRRALARLRGGLDLEWTPATSRDEITR